MWDEKGCHRSLSVRKISVLLSKSKNDSPIDKCKSLHGYISRNDGCHKSILEKNPLVEQIVSPQVSQASPSTLK